MRADWYQLTVFVSSDNSHPADHEVKFTHDPENSWPVHVRFGPAMIHLTRAAARDLAAALAVYADKEEA